MSNDTSAFGFGKFIPGFDFLQGLTRAGKEASASPLSSWVAPTVSVEEISKRIEELKAVQFWLEQNSRALAATVQALEVQKMTLSTLKGMNVSMADLAKSFTGHAAAASAAAPFGAAAEAAAAHAGWPMSSKPDAAPEAKAPPVAEKPKAQPDQAPAGNPDKNAGATSAGAASGSGDPMQWWGALTQQFQQIAAQALQDPAQQQAMAQATHMATDFTKAAMKAAGDIVRNATEAAQAPVAPKAAGKSKAAQPEAKSEAKPRAPSEAAAAASAKAPASKRAAASKTATSKTAAAKPAGKTAAKTAGKSTAARSPKR